MPASSCTVSNCTCQGTTSGSFTDNNVVIRNELHVVSNLSGSTRRVKQNGREYLIKKIRMIVPGVLNGSRGPLYYPPEEVGRNPKIWNGMPILVYHPKNGRSGRDPLVANEQEIGRVYNSLFNGMLDCEGWFDVELTKRVDNRVYDALINNTPLEVSTGLTADYDETPGVHNGIQYTMTVRNIGADHLAILPDQRGACSLDDGCGVMNSQNKTILQRLKEFIGLVENEEQETTDNSFPGHKGRPGQRGGSAPKEGGGGNSDEGELSAEDAAEYVERHNKLNELRKKNFSSYAERDAQQREVNDHIERQNEIIRKSKSKHLSHFDQMMSAHGYDGRRGYIKNTDSGDSLSSTTNEDSHSGLSTSLQEGGLGMAKLTAEERKTRIDKLVTNAAWKDHRKVLEGFQDEQLLTLNCGEGMIPKATDGNPPMEDEETEEQPAKPKPPVQNAAKKPTMAEYLANAPDELSPILRNALSSYTVEQDRQIGVILNHKGNKFSKEQLKTLAVKDYDTFNAIYNMADNGQSKRESGDDVIRNYLGAASAPVENSRQVMSAEEKKQAMPRARINYAENSPLVANAVNNKKNGLAHTAK